MTSPNGTPGQFVSASPGILREEVLKPLLSAPNEEITTQNMTKGCSPSFFKLIVLLQKNIEKRRGKNVK